MITARLNQSIVQILADVGAPGDGTSSNVVSNLAVSFFGLATVIAPVIIGWNFLSSLSGGGAEAKKSLSGHVQALVIAEIFFGGVWALIGQAHGFLPSFF